MAYKVSYKVVSEQGEQLKNIAKDMDNYSSRLSQIISKLGNDELLQSIRGDLNKFNKQLEEEKTVLNLAGQVIVEVLQSYTGAEKKSVQKVDRAKAHNRDFYKRPVSVPSAGGSAAGATNINISAASYESHTNVYVSGGETTFSASGATYTSAPGVAAGAMASAAETVSGAGMSAAATAGLAAAASGIAAAGGAAAANIVNEKNKKAAPGEA